MRPTNQTDPALSCTQDRATGYQVPGFAWVRTFTTIILITFTLFAAGVFWLITLAEMDVTVTAAGKIEPVRRHFIKSSVEGVLTKLLVGAGDRVVKGQVVAELDDTTLRAQLEKADRDLEANRLMQLEATNRRQRDLAVFEAERLQAMARQETASLQLEQVSREYRLYYDHTPTLSIRKRPPVESLLPVRIREAVYRQTVSELDAVTLKIKARQDGKIELRRLKSDQKKLEQDRFILRHRLDAMQIRSGVNGTVLTREVDQLVGDRILKGGQVLEVAELGKWQVKTHVKEIDFPRIRIGQVALLYVDAFPYTEFRVFEGVVSHLPGRIDPSTSENPVSTYPVVISILNRVVTDGERHYSLSYGMKTTTKIIIERGRVLDVMWRKLLRSVGRLGKPEVRISRGGVRR